MNDRDLSLALALIRSQTGGDHAAKPPSPPAFTITISREAGALGSSVAAEIGRRLGWAVYDQDILDKVAEKLHSSPRRVEEVDERPTSWLADCLGGFLDKGHVGPDAYLRHLFVVVRGLGGAGHCVIVGRGANFLLPPETTLRVRLVASQEARANAVAERVGMPMDEAAEWVENTERERLVFVKKAFRADAADPHHYDLVLNTTRLSVEDAADFILDALRRLQRRASPVAPRPAAMA